MRIKDKFRLLRPFLGEISDGVLRKGDVVVTINRTCFEKPWLVIKEDEEDPHPLSRQKNRVLRPRDRPFDEHKLALSYVVAAMPQFFGRQWVRDAHSGYNTDLILNTHLPEGYDWTEVLKLAEMEGLTNKIAEARRRQAELLEDFHRACTHRVIVEGKPLKGTLPEGKEISL